MRPMMLFAVLISAFIILPSLAYADLIDPGMKGITVNNTIDNTNDFPGWTFVAVPSGGPCLAGSMGGNMTVIDGHIPGFYKFCQYDVYAVSADRARSVLVIKNLASSYADVPLSNPVETKENVYHISLDAPVTQPSSTTTQGTIPAFVFILASLAGLGGCAYLWRKNG